jgi:hypothetical protein
LADRVFQVSHKNYQGIEWLEQQEEELLSRLSRAILLGEKGQVVVKGKEPINLRWDALLRRHPPTKSGSEGMLG